MPTLNLDRTIVSNSISQSKIINKNANSVAPDKTAHLDLRCLQKYLFWSGELKILHTLNALKLHTDIVDYLCEYKTVPSSLILKNLFGIGTMWTYERPPFKNIVSGYQRRSNILMFRDTFGIETLNASLLSIQSWRK